MPPNIGYAGDPILRQIRAMARSDFAQAQAEALKDRQRTLLEFGDVKLARSLFSRGGLTKEERAFLQSVRANRPLSTLGRIRHDFTEATDTANEAFNKQGLFYSGHRLKGLGDLERERTLATTDATRQTQRGLDEILRGLLGAQREKRRTILGAEEAAYQRGLGRFALGI